MGPRSFSQKQWPLRGHCAIAVRPGKLFCVDRRSGSGLVLDKLLKEVYRDAEVSPGTSNYQTAHMGDSNAVYTDRDGTN